MKIAEVIGLLEEDGWVLKRTKGSHRHFSHPSKPGLVTVAGKPSATLKPNTQWSILRPGWTEQAEEASVRGYVVVFEGDDAVGWSAYAPDLPGLGAAGDTREETERLVREAMGEHLALLREMGEPVPAPSEVSGVMVLDPATA